MELLQAAHERGFQPKLVAFDSWYSSLKNLKAIRDLGWSFLTRLKVNRQVNPEGKGLKAVSDCEISESGTRVHLKGFGLVTIFWIARKDADTNDETWIEYWCTNQETLNAGERQMFSEWVWGIEEYHRDSKQFSLVERCQCRTERLIRNDIQLALRAFLRLEKWSDQTGKSFHELKTGITREAVKNYLRTPIVQFKRVQEISSTA